MPPAPLAERLARYVARPDRDSFDELAIDAFTELHRRVEAFRELCDRVGAIPGKVTDWRQIPAAALEEHARDAPAPTALQRDAAETAFRAGALEALEAPPILQLVPEGEASPPGLAVHAARLTERFGGPGSARAVAGARVGVVPARSWLAARQRDRRAAVLLATAASLRRLTGALARQDLRFQLAPGSRVVVMDVLAADPGEPVPPGLERLGLGTSELLGRLAWEGIPTPLYGRLTEGGLVGALPCPWVRIATTEPASGREPAGGAPGLLSVLDLTILDRPFRLRTPTRGSVENGRVRVARAG